MRQRTLRSRITTCFLSTTDVRLPLPRTASFAAGRAEGAFLMRGGWKPASLCGCLALGLAFLAGPRTANAQTDIPVPNGSFEQPDPASSVKPLGWFRRGFGSFQPT